MPQLVAAWLEVSIKLGEGHSDLSWSRTRIRFLDDRPLVLDAVDSPLRTRYYLRLYDSRFRLLHHLFTHSLLALLNPISSEDGCLIDIGREGRLLPGALRKGEKVVRLLAVGLRLEVFMPRSGARDRDGDAMTVWTLDEEGPLSFLHALDRLLLGQLPVAAVLVRAADVRYTLVRARAV